MGCAAYLSLVSLCNGLACLELIKVVRASIHIIGLLQAFDELLALSVAVNASVLLSERICVLRCRRGLSVVRWNISGRSRLSAPTSKKEVANTVTHGLQG